MDATYSANGQRQTATLNYEISTVWATKPRMILLQTSRQLMGKVQVTRPKTLQAILLLLLLFLNILFFGGTFKTDTPFQSNSLFIFKRKHPIQSGYLYFYSYSK